MKGKKLDYSIKAVAEQSKNKTALSGICIMNVILAVAYLLEVFKDTRSIGSYCVVAALCFGPTIAGIIIYCMNKQSALIRYKRKKTKIVLTNDFPGAKMRKNKF